jgi:hypothetical protein
VFDVFDITMSQPQSKAEELKKELVKAVKKEIREGGKHVTGELSKAGKQLAAEPGKWADQLFKSLGF